jgi:Trk K+ transport system NAD-binding subunit
MIPHGETIIQEGDLLVAVVEGEARSQMANLCKRSQLN